MDQIKLLNFADFFFNISKEELDEEYLTDGEREEQPDTGQLKIQELIREKQAELLLEQGRKFKENYIKLKAENEINESEVNFAGSHLAIAYRKKTDDSSDTDDSEAKMMELIRKAKENNSKQ